MNEPVQALVVGLLAVVVIAGAVMLIANRMPGRQPLVRMGFLVVLAVLLVFIGLYTVPVLIGGYGIDD